MEDDLGMDRRLSLIDVSSIDDCLIDLSLADSFTLESAETEASQGGHDRAKLTEQIELLPTVHGLSEPNQMKKPKCNLRKSLAWDNAFFTSQGVLDNDELAMVNKTFKKAEAPPLPRIEEDIRRSAESNTTIGSDRSALESLEVDLFEHLRSSIRHSSDESDKASDVSSCSSKAGSGKAGPSSRASTKKLEPASRDRSKLTPASKKQNCDKQHLDKISKEALSHQRVGPTKSREQKIASKPPKILSRTRTLPIPPATPTPLTASDFTKAKVIRGTVGYNQQATASTKSFIPRSVSSPKSSAGLPNMTHSRHSGPSPKSSSGLPSLTHNTYSGTSSDSIGKFVSKSTRNKSESRNLDQTSAGPTVKTPLRISTKKTEFGKINPSSYVMTASKFSTTSPASSVDGWSSSESSSSTPRATQRLTSSKANLDTRSQSSLSAENALESVPCKLTDSQLLNLQKNSEAGLLSQSVKRGPPGNDVPSHPPAVDILRSKVNTSSGMRCLKPSGLRMPTPKIGFFDVEKIVTRASNGTLESHSNTPSTLIKSTCGISKLCVKSNNKPQSAGSVAQTATISYSSPCVTLTSPFQFCQLQSPSLQPAGEIQVEVGGTKECTQGSYLNNKVVQVEVADTIACDKGCYFNVEDNSQKAMKNCIVSQSALQAQCSYLNKREVQVEVADSIECGKGFYFNVEDNTSQNAMKTYIVSQDAQQSDSNHENQLLSAAAEERMGEREPSPVLDIKNSINCGDSKSVSCCVEPLGYEKKVDIVVGSQPRLCSPAKIAIKSSSRTPLAVNSLFCNRTKLFELTMEEETENVRAKIPVVPISEKGKAGPLQVEPVNDIAAAKGHNEEADTIACDKGCYFNVEDYTSQKAMKNCIVSQSAQQAQGSYLNKREVQVEVADSIECGKGFYFNVEDNTSQNGMKTYIVSQDAQQSDSNHENQLLSAAAEERMGEREPSPVLDINCGDSKSVSCCVEPLGYEKKVDMVVGSPRLCSPAKIAIKSPSRTPLAVNSLFCNRSKLFELTMEEEAENVRAKISVVPISEKGKAGPLQVEPVNDIAAAKSHNEEAITSEKENNLDNLENNCNSLLVPRQQDFSLS